MNSKICKRISRRADQIQFEWFKTIIPEHEHDKVNIDNFKQYVPKTSYFYNNGKLMLSTYCDKWLRKGLKKIHCSGQDINQISIEDIELKMNK